MADYLIEDSLISPVYGNIFLKFLTLKLFCLKLLIIDIQRVMSRSRLTVVSREAKEEVPCEGLSTNAREYFTRTNLVKIKNAITGEPSRLALYNPR